MGFAVAEPFALPKQVAFVLVTLTEIVPALFTVTVSVLTGLAHPLVFVVLKE